MAKASCRNRLRHPAVRMGVLGAAFFCTFLLLGELLYVLFPRQYLQWTPFVDRVWHAYVQATLVTGTGSPPMSASEREVFEEIKRLTKSRLMEEHPEAIADGLLQIHVAHFRDEPLPFRPDFVIADDSLMPIFKTMTKKLLTDCIAVEGCLERMYEHLFSKFDEYKLEPGFWRTSIKVYLHQIDPQIAVDFNVVKTALWLFAHAENEKVQWAAGDSLYFYLCDWGGKHLGDIVLTCPDNEGDYPGQLSFPRDALLKRFRRNAGDPIAWEVLCHVDYCRGASFGPVVDFLMQQPRVLRNRLFLFFLSDFADDRVERQLIKQWLHASGRHLQSLHAWLVEQGRLRSGDIALWQQALARQMSEADLEYLLHRPELAALPETEQRLLCPQLEKLACSANDKIARRACQLLLRDDSW